MPVERKYSREEKSQKKQTIIVGRSGGGNGSVHIGRRVRGLSRKQRARVGTGSRYTLKCHTQGYTSASEATVAKDSIASYNWG